MLRRWAKRLFFGFVSGPPFRERFRLRVEQAEVGLPGLAPELAGLRIALLTDLHVGHYAGPELAELAFGLAAAAEPDLLVLGGDLVHDGAGPELVAAAARAAGRVRSPLGAYAVLGNHDYWAGADRVEAALAGQGVAVLVNAGRPVAVGDGLLWLAGLDSALAGRPDLAGATAGAGPRDLTLVAVHEPDYADEAAPGLGGLCLQLSGHSHGGQVRAPGLGPLGLPPLGRRYPRGLSPVDGQRYQVYTSRGIGVTAVPVRLGSPPEVSILTLKRI